MGEGAPQSDTPSDEQTTTQVQLPEARGKRAARSPAVLVVGDGEPLGEALLDCMKHRGLVVAASPTERAIASAVARAPDLVVLVGDAAKEGGQRTIRMLATRPTTARLPVVVVEDAAGDALDRRLRALRAGALAIVDRSASADAMAGRVADLAIFVADHGKRTAAGIDVTLDELASVVRKELGQLLPDEDGAGATMEAPGREMAEAIERFVASVRAMVRRSDPDGARLRGAPAVRSESESIAAAELAAFDDGATHALRGARILLVVGDAGRGDTLATELRARAATVVVSGPSPEGLARARELDPEVVLVDGDALQPEHTDVVGWLSHDARLRWSPVVVTGWDELAPRGAKVPRMTALAERIAPCRAVERDLVARAHEEARLDVDIASLGPCRALRALASVPHVLSVTTLEDPGGLLIDVANGLVAGATQRDGGAGLAALARFLALPPCTLHVERRRAPQSANILLPVEDALALAGRELFASLGIVPDHDDIEPVTIPGTKAAPRVAAPRPAAPRPAAPRPTAPRTAEPRPAEPPAAEPRQPPMDLLDDASDTATDVSPLRKDLPRLSIEPGALADVLEPDAAALRAPAPLQAGKAAAAVPTAGVPPAKGAHKRTLMGVAPPFPTMSTLPSPVAGAGTPAAAPEPSSPAASALPNPFAPRGERPPPLPTRSEAGRTLDRFAPLPAKPPPLQSPRVATAAASAPLPDPLAPPPATTAATADPFAPLSVLSPLDGSAADPLGALEPPTTPADLGGSGAPSTSPRPRRQSAGASVSEAPARPSESTSLLPDAFTPRSESAPPLPDAFAPRSESAPPLPDAFAARSESVRPLPDPFSAPPAASSSEAAPPTFAPAVAAAVPRAAPVAATRPKSGPSAAVVVLGLLAGVVLVAGVAFVVWRFVIAPTPSAPIASIPLTPPVPAHVVGPPTPARVVAPTPVPVPTATTGTTPAATPIPSPAANVVTTPTPTAAPNVVHVAPTPTPPTVVVTPTPTPAPTPVPTPTSTPTPVAETPSQLDAPLPEVEQSEALTEQARALLEHHDDAGAEPLLLQAAQLGPRNPHPMEALARIYLARGDGPHAVEWAEKLVAVRHRRAAFRVLLGDARKLAGDQAGAETAWRDALTLEPDNHDAHARLGE